MYFLVQYMDISLLVKKLCNNAYLPEKATNGSAGYDLRSIDDTVINPGEYKAISTGIAIEMPLDIEAQIRPRSGLAFKHGITVLNSPGTIDSDYRGEIKIALINHSNETFNITSGMKIAQMIFSKVISVSISTRDELTQSDRGEGGFGSTGY